MIYRLNAPPFPEEDRVSILADWVELSVLGEGKQISRGKIQTTLSRESISRPEARAGEVWAELQRRAQLSGRAWPLRIDDIRITPGEYNRNLYLYHFLCALSLGYNVDDDGRRLFEYCVTDLIVGISRQFALRLGFPRTMRMPASLDEAVSLYTRLSREVYKDPIHVVDKDLGLDIVTWIGFRDPRGGYLHLIGQCATGSDWHSKMHDLDIKVWKDHVTWAVDPVRFFALPHVVPAENWRRACLKGGLILDRPRLLNLAHVSPLGRPRIGAVLSYCRSIYGSH